MPTAHGHHSAHALNVHEQFYLVDCGEGTQMRLMQAGISPLKLRAVFVSHLHGDHVYGLFPMLSTMGLLGRRERLRVFAPAPFDRMLAFYREYFEKGLPFEVVWREVDTRRHELLFETRALEVWSLPLRHSLPAAGYLFREKTPALNVCKEAVDAYGLDIARIVAAKRGEDIMLSDGRVIANGDITYRPYGPRSYAYCSDTNYSAKVAGLVAGVDLLYHEATFASSEGALARDTGHSTALQAARAAATAGAGRLLIGHFSNRYKDRSLLLDEARSLFPATEIAEELAAYDIPLRKYSGC